MSFAVTHGLDPLTGVHVVTARVRLSLTETNSLFLSGDIIVSWPEAALLGVEDPAPVEASGTSVAAPVRTGMFISELARLTPGLKIGYRQAAEAERAAQLLRLQLRRAGIEEEA